MNVKLLTKGQPSKVCVSRRVENADDGGKKDGLTEVETS